MFRKKNKKKNFIVIETYHERYSFSQEITYWNNTTIDKVLEEVSCNNVSTGKRELVMRPYGEDGFWTIDRSCSSTKIFDEEFYPFIKKHIETIAIVDLDWLSKEGYANNIFCNTLNKFGMYDYDIRGDGKSGNKDKA